jgi:glycosyltransferase involved in cell wall biosynthesis
MAVQLRLPDEIRTATGGGEPLRIAMVAPSRSEPSAVDPGGAATAVADLVDRLVDHLAVRGHHVTLIAPGPERTRAARFLPVDEGRQPARPGGVDPVLRHAAAVGALLADLDVDLVHDHSLAGPLLARGRPGPTVVTVHGPVHNYLGRYLHWLGDTVDAVAVCAAQRRPTPEVNWVGVIPDAIDVSAHPLGGRRGDHVLWMGRFRAEWGPHLAVDAARRAGLRIVLAGCCGTPAERAFLDEEIRPRLGADVEYLGGADPRARRQLLAEATALVLPVSGEDPPGTVPLEAMASGTPVVALRRGAPADLVAHGVSGLLVDDPDRLPAALRAAADLDPRRCRQHVERSFDLPVMTEGYERVYRMLIEGGKDLGRLMGPLPASPGPPFP